MTNIFRVLLGALQSLTGKYREIQGNPCNENREPAMRTGFPCNESRFFPVGIDLQGKAVSCTGFGFTVYIQDYLNHGLRTPREQIAFTARPKIQSQSQIFRYG